MVCFLANCALKYIMIAFSVFNFSYRDYCCGFPKNNETKQSYVSGKITCRMADSIAKHPMLRSTFAKLIFWPWHISSKFLFNKASALEAILRVALFRLLAPPNERRYLSSSTKSVETCSKSLSNSLFMESCKNWLNRRMFLNQSTHFFLSFWANLGLNVLRDKIHISQKVYSFLTLFFLWGGGGGGGGRNLLKITLWNPSSFSDHIGGRGWVAPLYDPKKVFEPLWPKRRFSLITLHTSTNKKQPRVSRLCYLTSLAAKGNIVKLTKLSLK